MHAIRNTLLNVCLPMQVLMEESLSEGEVLSDGSASDSGEDPPSGKKLKLETCSDNGSTATNRKKTRRISRKEKKRRKKEIRKQKGSKERTSDSKPSPKDILKKWQLELLRQLVKLSQGQKPDNPNSLFLKTGMFKEVLLHLLGEPQLNSPLEGIESLRENRIVVVWLSMVSAEIFSSSDEHFKKLKSLNPCLQFTIEHPGSSRFVKLGLEAFILQQKDEEKPRATVSIDGEQLTAADYLMSMGAIHENAFPLPSTSTAEDQSQYMHITEWPASNAALREVTGVPMFAVDCEMVETGKGLELARVSVVDSSLGCIYDALVKPDSEVIDYKTRFSGIDESMLENITTTLADVHSVFGRILPSNCILVGHSLENDLHALKLVHPYVIDTSCLFTPLATPMSKPSLRMLTKKLLGQDIQGEGGHNSVEDATACMKLVLLKMREGKECTIPWNEGTRSVLGEVAAHNHSTGIIDKQSIINLFGRGSTHSCVVKSDEDVIQQAKTTVPKCDFTFLQLHAMEIFLKSDQRGDGDKLKEVVESLDTDIISIVEDCPKKSLVFVVCGSSDIREVKRLYQQPEGSGRALKAACMVARTGQVVAFIVN